MVLPIEDYALIGDCETAALVGRDGSIDWLCLPRFDSGACFAAILGDHDNGRWLIAPTDPKAKVTRRYRPDTLILETRFETDTGAATVIDFMYPCEQHPHLVRLVVGEKGAVEFETEFVVRFGYGEEVPWVTTLPDHRLRAVAGPNKIVLQSTIKLRGEDFRTKGKFTVKSGETISFALSYIEVFRPRSPRGRCREPPRKDRAILEGLVVPMQQCRPLRRRGETLADHAESHDLRADRRRGRGGDHLAA